MTTTAWHRIKRADFYALSIDSHDADQCAIVDCPGEVVEPGSDRFDMRDSWMQGERDRRSYSADDRIARLAELQAAVARAEAQLTSEVRNARLAGLPWSSVGGALGVTRQAAQQRYAR